VPLLPGRKAPDRCQKPGLSGALSHKVLIFGAQLILGLFVIRIQRDAVDRTDIHTLRRVIVADTFGAQVGVDHVDFFALGDGPVGAFGFAHS